VLYKQFKWMVCVHAHMLGIVWKMVLVQRQGCCALAVCLSCPIEAATATTTAAAAAAAMNTSEG
jgi:hypothetical protein